MGRLTRKVGLVALGRGANALAIYAVYALAARTWDKAQCEVFAALWVLSNALVPIFLIGLPTAVLYFFPRRENTRGLALQAGCCALGSALFLGGLLHVAGIARRRWIDNSYEIVFIIAIHTRTCIMHTIQSRPMEALFSPFWVHFSCILVLQ